MTPDCIEGFKSATGIVFQQHNPAIKPDYHDDRNSHSTMLGNLTSFSLQDDVPLPAVEHLSVKLKKRPNSKRKKTVVRVSDLVPLSCCACTSAIVDRYMLQVDEKQYHLNCLRCVACQKCLELERSCYVKNDGIYCKQDYIGLFGARCSKCCRSIAATDWVRRARECVYHLACFACDTCKRQLSSGEEFTLVTVDGDTLLLCKTHYSNTLEGSSGKNKDDSDNSSTSSNGKPKTKRMRTTFTDEQLQVLQVNFNLDSNPDGQDLERIAQMTGLSKRVTQVWFQNSRARQKKHQQQNQRKLNGSRQACSMSQEKIAVSNGTIHEPDEHEPAAHQRLDPFEHSLSPQSSCGDNIDSNSQFSSNFL